MTLEIVLSVLPFLHGEKNGAWFVARCHCCPFAYKCPPAPRFSSRNAHLGGSPHTHLAVVLWLWQSCATFSSTAGELIPLLLSPWRCPCAGSEHLSLRTILDSVGFHKGPFLYWVGPNHLVDFCDLLHSKVRKHLCSFALKSTDNQHSCPSWWHQSTYPLRWVWLSEATRQRSEGAWDFMTSVCPFT